MESERFGSHHIIRLDAEEEIRESLYQFASRQDIRGAYFLAFGAFRTARLACFDAEHNTFQYSDITSPVDIANLTGNIAVSEGNPVIHMYATLVNNQQRVYGGRLTEGIVYPALEVFLTPLIGELRREKDPGTGIEQLILRQLAVTKTT